MARTFAPRRGRGVVGYILRSAQIERLPSFKLVQLLRAADSAPLQESRRQPLADVGALKSMSTLAAGDINALEVVKAALGTKLWSSGMQR